MLHATKVLPGIPGRAPTAALLLAGLLACLLIAACGGETTDDGGAGRGRNGSPAAEGGVAGTAGAASPGEKPTPPGTRSVRIRVAVRKAGDGSPLFSSKVILFVQTTEDPRSVITRQIWTDGSGIAEQGIDQVHRLALLTEYDRVPREIGLDGDVVDVSITVETEFPLLGRVVDPEGRPLPDAEVLVCATRGGTAPPPLPPATGGFGEYARKHYQKINLSCRTDEAGSFEGTVGHRQPLVVTASAPGFLTADWRFIHAGDGASAAEAVDVVLRPACKMRALFLDTRGQPIRNTKVVAREADESGQMRRYRERIAAPFRATTGTDGEGLAEFDIPAGIDLLLESGAAGGKTNLFSWDGKTVSGRDFEEESPIGPLRAAAGETLSLVATPPRQVRVACTVRDSAGKPVAGALLSLPGLSARTDPQGEVSLMAPYSRSGTKTFSVTAPGFCPFEGSCPVVEPGGPRQIALSAVLEEAPLLTVDAGSAALRVWIFGSRGVAPMGRVAGGGEPLPSEELLVRSTGRKDGAWLFPLTAGPAEEVLVQTGDYTFHVEGGLPGTEGGLATVRPPEPGPGIRLEGRIAIPEGSRPHTIDLVLMRNDIAAVRRFDPFGFRGKAGWTTAPVDAEGSFAVDGLAPGRYACAASLAEWGVRTDIYGELTIVPDGEPPLFVLAPSADEGMLEIVVDDGVGRPVPDAAFLLLDPVDSPIASSATMGSRFFTDLEGRITCPAMAPGRYGFVLLSAPGREGASVAGRAVVKAGEQTSVRIVLD